ncbi:MAG: hypothetical protein SXA11_06845 [Cyanobacteriota bacterium]|nr:hypothetical protein [Cyanobacteriota bacterium]
MLPLLKYLFGGGAEAGQMSPLPDYPHLQVSRQAVERWQKTGTITDTELAELQELKLGSDRTAKNAKAGGALIEAIAKNEITITQAYSKAKTAAEKSQAAQTTTRYKARQTSRQIITQAQDAIAAAGGGAL